MAQVSSERLKFNVIFQILKEENELDTDNILNMHYARDFKNQNLISKEGDLFLTVDSLIRLNNIITGSININLRTCNVKPDGYDRYYMNFTRIEAELYRLVDRFNERQITARQFCNYFLNHIHPFRDGNGRTCKILFEDKTENFNKIHMQKRGLFEQYFFPNTINTH